MPTARPVEPSAIRQEAAVLQSDSERGSDSTNCGRMDIGGIHCPVFLFGDDVGSPSSIAILYKILDHLLMSCHKFGLNPSLPSASLQGSQKSFVSNSSFLHARFLPSAGRNG